MGAFPRNTRRPTHTRTMNRIAAWKAERELTRGNGFVAHSMINGAIITLLTMSPSHHVSQMAQKSPHDARWPIQRVVTPTVGLINVLSIAAKRTNLKILFVRAKASAPLANRMTNLAPTTASSVLPVAIASEVTTEPCVRMLTRKAPPKTPGQSRVPPSNRAAKARPLGGHTAEAL